MKKKNNWFIGSGLPGTGKSHTVKSYKNNTILFVPSFNALVQDIMESEDIDATTCSLLLGIHAEGQDYIKMKQYNIDKYDCICFDEILLNPSHILQKIDLFMISHPTIKIFSTGDVDQLQPIDFRYNNVPNKKQYMTKCINQMFPNHITLKIPKRVETDAEREIICQLKSEIFDENKNIIDILKNR